MIGRTKITLGVATLLLACGSLVGADKLDTGNAATEARLKTDIFFLASKECEGRGPTTAGLDKAADYIANKFKEAGLKPAGADGTYFQPFGLPGMVLTGKASLTLTAPDARPRACKVSEEFQPLAVSGGGTFKDAPVVFAGFGIKSETLKYDDYADLDCRDKVVVVLRNHPRDGKPDAKTWEPAAALAIKVATAEKAGAVAVLLVNDKTLADDDLIPFEFYSVLRNPKGPATKIPAFQISRKLAGELLEKTGKSLADREATIIENLKPQSAELKGYTFAGALPSKVGSIPLKNVIGVVEGKGPLADETVVIGAHYDHLGYAGAGGSAAKVKKPTLHNGADDNASGTTAVLELVRRFAAQKDRVGRRLVFMAFSGEELGLLGSVHYCKTPLFPLDKSVAMFNLDMVGRLPKDDKTGKEKLLVEASTSAKEWSGLLDKWNEKHAFEMQRNKGLMAASDHASFYAKGLPVLFIWTGTHPDYHRPTDTADKINLVGMRRIVDLGDDVIAHLGATTSPPQYQKVAGGNPTRPSGTGPRIGITAGSAGSQEGVLVEEVVQGGPAEKAGMKAGDRIVELAGKPVKDFDALTAVLADQQPGKEVELAFFRADKKQTVKLTPSAPMALPRLGIRPTDDEKEGVLVQMITEGGPAEKAGLKIGDVIIELAGKPVKNVAGYMTVIATQKAGEEMAVTILRAGKQQTIKVKPE